MKTAFIISLVIYGLLSVIQLYFCFKESEKERKITKILLMPVLLIAVALSECTNTWLFVAIFGALIGDIFMLNNKNTQCFLFGNISFMIGHLIFAYLIINRLSYDIPAGIYLIVAIAMVLFITFTYDLTHKLIKKLVVSSSLYGLILACLTTLSIMLIVDTKSIYAWMILIGYIFYFISDLTLAFATFIKDFKRRDFYIMITYIIAETSIVLGLLFVL